MIHKQLISLFLLIACPFLQAQTCLEFILNNLSSSEKQNVLDTSAFCKGYNEAMTYEYIALRYTGDPGHLSPCEFDSYKRYGVQLEMTGDIIYDNSIYQQNEGFNAFMFSQIDKKIPYWKDSLGKLPKEMRLFDQKLSEEFKQLFTYTIDSSTHVLVQLDSNAVKNSFFQSLEGIQITDVASNRSFTDKELYEGVYFQIKNENRLYLMFDLSNYAFPNRLCIKEKFRIPVKL